MLGIQNSYILQARYESRLSDKARCSEASRFSIIKIWYAYLILTVSPKPAVPNPNGLLSQKLCHYLNKGRTLNGLL